MRHVQFFLIPHNNQLTFFHLKISFKNAYFDDSYLIFHDFHFIP